MGKARENVGTTIALQFVASRNATNRVDITVRRPYLECMSNERTLTMQPLTTLDHWDINTRALMAADFSAGHIIAAENADFEMVSDANSGILRSLKVINSYHGTFTAIGVDSFGVGSEHVVFEREDGARVLFFYKLEA